MAAGDAIETSGEDSAGDEASLRGWQWLVVRSWGDVNGVVDKLGGGLTAFISGSGSRAIAAAAATGSPPGRVRGGDWRVEVVGKGMTRGWAG